MLIQETYEIRKHVYTIAQQYITAYPPSHKLHKKAWRLYEMAEVKLPSVIESESSVRGYSVTSVSGEYLYYVDSKPLVKLTNVSDVDMKKVEASIVAIKALAPSFIDYLSSTRSTWFKQFIKALS